MHKFVLLGVTLTAGIGMGALLDRNLFNPSHVAVEVSADGNAPSAPLQGTLSVAGTSVTSAVSFDIEPLRAMVREELALASSKALAKSGASSSVPQPAPVAEASSEQRRDSLQVVDTLISSGHWGNEERNTFHQKLAVLDPQQREQAMQQLVQALNSGTLKASTEGPPF
jgi:hypothetical protein